MTAIQNHSWKVYFPVFVACLSLFALGWMDNARGPFFPLFLKATGVSATKGALFFALTSFVAILSSATAGWWIEKKGVKFLLILGGCAMALSPFGVWLWPSLKGALVTALLFGISLGWVAVSQNVLVGQVEDPKLKRRFFSLLHCFYALAAMAAPISIVQLSRVFPWSAVLFGVSALCVLFLGFALFLKPRVVFTQREDVSSVGPLGWPKEIVYWVVFMSFYVAAELILSTRLVVLMESYGYTFELASKALAYFFLGMFVSRIFFFVFKINWSALAILLFCLLVSLLFFALGVGVSPWWFSCLGFSVGPVFPVVMELLSKKWEEHFDLVVSRVISISSCFVVASHILVGKFTDLYGIQWALGSVFVFLLFAFLTLVFLTVFSCKNKGLKS